MSKTYNSRSIVYTTPFDSLSYSELKNFLHYKDLALPYRYQKDPQKNFLQDLKRSLCQNNWIMLGVTLDDSFFESGSKTLPGVIKTPKTSTFHPTGGHCITLVGYGAYDRAEPNKTLYKFLNS